MTFVTIYTDVLDRLGESGTAITTKVKRWINQAYRDVCSRANFSCLQETTTLSEVANTEGVSLSTLDWLKIYSIIRTDPTTGKASRPLNCVEPDYYDTHYYDNTTSGDPHTYTVWENALKLYPRPDETGANSLSVRFLEAPTELSTDEGVPILPASAHDLLVLKAYAIGLQETEAQGDINAVLSEYEAGVRQLIASETGKNSVSQQPSFAFPYKDYVV